MAPPRETLWELEGHSKAKHEILRRYLGGWLPIMAKWNGRLLLLDGFAGPGRYTGGEDGSPLIMLKTYLEHSQRDRISAELVYAFIEENLARAEHLESEIAGLGKLPDNVRWQVIHGNFEDVFRDQVEHLQERNQQLAPTFAKPPADELARLAHRLSERSKRDSGGWAVPGSNGRKARARAGVNCRLFARTARER